MLPVAARGHVEPLVPPSFGQSMSYDSFVTYIDNPAGRLLAVLQAARTQPVNTPAIHGWASVFDIDRNDSARVLTYGARLIESATAIREAVEKFDEDDPGLRLTYFPEVETTVAKFVSVGSLSMQHFLADLHPKTGEHSLEWCSALLHRKAGESMIESDTVRDLRAQLEELVQAVLDAEDLNSAIKSWILRCLADILIAIDGSNIFGFADVRDATDRLIGGLVGNAGRASEVKKSGVFKKLGNFIIALDLALNLAANTYQLASGENASTPPSPSPQVVQIFEGNVDHFEILQLPPGSSSSEHAK